MRVAGEANAYGELAALITDLAAAASEPETRVTYLHELAALYEEKLQDPLRAVVTLNMARQSTLRGRDLAEIQPLLRLAEATGRIEDALALLEVATAANAPLELRRRPSKSGCRCARPAWATPSGPSTKRCDWCA